MDAGALAFGMSSVPYAREARNPLLSCQFAGSFLLRFAARTLPALELFQQPPRSARSAQGAAMLLRFVAREQA